MGASRIQVWQYITAIVLIFVLVGHLVERVPFITGKSYEESLESDYVHKMFKGKWSIGLLILAYVALFHGLNGVRGMLYEWLPGRRREKLWDVLFWLVFIVFAVIATYAVVNAP